jgi:CubicO group peptidase (beta-lactamase class C family)
MNRRARVVLGLAIPAAIVGGLLTRPFSSAAPGSTEAALAYADGIAGNDVPGIQYVVVTADEVLADFAAGWADIAAMRPMTSDTTMMAFSMTKTFTAAAVLQLVEDGRLGLDDELDDHVPDTPYAGRGITVRQLLAHTAGIPNPIPLRWVHLAEDEASFDEAAALQAVMRENPKLDAAPGERYGYSNIGYWLLGRIIEDVTGVSYAEHIESKILEPLGVSEHVTVGIGDPAKHASGYLARFSFTNLLKGLMTDSAFWGEYEGDWLRIRNHHLDGPAFGGLVGSARDFSRFVQDQLSGASALFTSDTQRLFEAAQSSEAGDQLHMTLGWHVGEADGEPYLFKEGGGGGFHAEMRIYPERGTGSVVMVNNTEFDSTTFLNRVDRPFLDAAGAPGG